MICLGQGRNAPGLADLHLEDRLRWAGGGEVEGGVGGEVEGVWVGGKAGLFTGGWVCVCVRACVACMCAEPEG